MQDVRFRSLAAAFVMLSWSCVPLHPPARAQQVSPKDDTVPLTRKLGGGDRFLTHVSTDKPIYRSGDEFFSRAVMLHHKTRKPVPNNIVAAMEIRGAKGETVATLAGVFAEGVASFRWKIPMEIAGGQYTAKVSPSTGDAPAERSFEIRAYRPPRLRSQINFLSKGYSSGEQVTAFLKTERAEGGIPAGAQVTIVARVDNTEVHRSVSRVDDSGNCMARFDLPNAIERGEGTLAMIVDDGGVVETASKTIPLLLQHVDLNLYPEGGTLVAGLENRIYFEAFTPAHKPADIAGIIVDQRGTKVGSFATEHEGRGRFRVTPESGRKYFLAIQKPAGVEIQYPLPELVDDGVAIRALSNTFESDQQIAVSVTSSSTSDFVVALSHRGDEIESVDVRLTARVPRTITFDASKNEGVFAVTVWKRDGEALAERLVFRRPSRVLNVAIEPDSKQYIPGGKASITLTTTDQNGMPVEGVVGVTVTDDSVLEMLETRDQSPRLPAMVYLENDVLDLADAHVYLDTSNKDAPLAIDLLLGTQGWRRFITVDIQKAIKDYGDVAKRALAFRSPMAARNSTARRLQERFMWMNQGLQLNDGILEGAEFQDEPLGRAVDDRFEVDKGALDKNGGAPLPLPPGAEAIPEPADAAKLEAPIGPKAPADEKPLGDSDDAAIADMEDGAKVGLRELVRQPERNARGGRFRKNDIMLRQSAERLDVASLFSNAQVQLREYAFKADPNRQPNQRTDFTETLFWSAATKTDQNGQAIIEFDLNDSVTSFKVMADGFTTTGVIGAGTKIIESVEPFYVEPKLPLEVTSGDFLQIPLSLINATTSNMDDGLLSVRSDSWKSVQDSQAPFRLLANHRDRKFLGVQIGTFHGDARLTIDARSGAYSDQVTRKLVVKPQGFPVQNAFGGIISPSSNIRHAITIPADVVAGSVTARISVHPSPLASMTESLAGLIREPHGCFEQTSSSNFPLVMAQQYFQSHVGVDPELIKRSAEMLDKGYQKLISFECDSKGFEWFGSDPGHDALTAYGLLEFTEMARIQHVDTDLLERTTQWMLQQRDGNGGYLRRTQTLHTWVADPECANSYNTWALLEAGIDANLDVEIDWVRKAAKATKNSYVLALAANVMAKANDEKNGKEFCRRLRESVEEDGSVGGATTSVVGSGGEALSIETTSLAIMAWLNHPDFTPAVERSIQYLAQKCKAGRFGSTQSTILALRSIIRYDEMRSRPKSAGSLRLLIDGNQIGDRIAFDEKAHESIELPHVAGLLTPGGHNLQIEMVDGSDMPYSVEVAYHRVTPDSSAKCKLSLNVELSDAIIGEGDITEVRVDVGNVTDIRLPTPIAIIGIPGGLEVRHEQLKELKSEGRIAAYEVIGREIVLYWRAFEPNHRIDLPISLVAAVPGEYSAPSSRVYQYYTDEHKHWVAGPTVAVVPK